MHSGDRNAFFPCRQGNAVRGEVMKVSFFETAHYRTPRKLPAEWPVPPDAYDRDAGMESYRGMVERCPVSAMPKHIFAAIWCCLT
jgi:hypothetical protein